jgi:hypothetical protein
MKCACCHGMALLLGGALGTCLSCGEASWVEGEGSMRLVHVAAVEAHLAEHGHGERVGEVQSVTATEPTTTVVPEPMTAGVDEGAPGGDTTAAAVQSSEGVQVVDMTPASTDVTEPMTAGEEPAQVGDSETKSKRAPRSRRS